MNAKAQRLTTVLVAIALILVGALAGVALTLGAIALNSVLTG